MLFRENLIAPVLRIDRDLDEPQRLLTRSVLQALRRFEGRGATRAELQKALQDERQAMALVPTVLAEALHDELVNVEEPTNPEARWVLNSLGEDRLSQAEAQDGRRRRRA